MADAWRMMMIQDVWGQFPLSSAIKCSHFKSGGKKEEMGEIKKQLPSDLKITLIQLQQ